MGCNGGCGGRANADRQMGGHKNPVLFGNKDRRAPQPAKFLEQYGSIQRGSDMHVAGDGVEDAVERGIIRVGLSRKQPKVHRVPPPKAPKPAAVKAHEFYVAVPGKRNTWIGFESRAEAERKQPGVTILTREQALGRKFRTEDD